MAINKKSSSFSKRQLKIHSTDRRAHCEFSKEINMLISPTSNLLIELKLYNYFVTCESRTQTRSH